jgi:acyl-CoA synthetase (AMP-forming)/AMP-acid ligase II
MSKGMKECRLFEKIVVIQRFDKPYDTKQIPKTERLENFLNTTSSQGSPPIARVGFQDPMMIYYSSGTTGTPKAIVHGVGPLLMNSHKDGVIHRDTTPSDVGLQYTTTGWIMYLASVAVMMFGARAVLYDGSPFVPDLKVLLRVAEEQGVTSMGISPRWMGELMKNGVAPREVADLRKLRLVTSTGMVLPDQLFEWFYDVAFPKDVHLANISGGTDIVSASGFFLSCSPAGRDSLLTRTRLVASPWIILSSQCMLEAVKEAVSVFRSRCSITISPKVVKGSLYPMVHQVTSSQPVPSRTSPSTSGTIPLPRPPHPAQAQNTSTPTSPASAPSGLKATSAPSTPSQATFTFSADPTVCSIPVVSASAVQISMRC